MYVGRGSVQPAGCRPPWSCDSWYLLGSDPPCEQMTHRCKNITFPKPSFAGGNNQSMKMFPLCIGFADKQNRCNFQLLLKHATLKFTCLLQWWIYDFPDRGHQTQRGCANLLFWKFPSENCMKLRKKVLGEGRAYPLLAFVVICLIIISEWLWLSQRLLWVWRLESDGSVNWP